MRDYLKLLILNKFSPPGPAWPRPANWAGLERVRSKVPASSFGVKSIHPKLQTNSAKLKF